MKLNTRLAIVTSVLLLFVVLWWTRYEVKTPNNPEYVVIFDRLTHKIYLVTPLVDHWVEFGAPKKDKK
jgi:hypothetical protein